MVYLIGSFCYDITSLFPWCEWSILNNMESLRQQWHSNGHGVLIGWPLGEGTIFWTEAGKNFNQTRDFCTVTHDVLDRKWGYFCFRTGKSKPMIYDPVYKSILWNGRLMLTNMKVLRKSNQKINIDQAREKQQSVLYWRSRNAIHRVVALFSNWDCIKHSIHSLPSVVE